MHLNLSFLRLFLFHRCKLAKTKSEKPLSFTPPFGAGSLGKEWRFLCACASPAADREQILDCLVSGLQWDAILELAAEHGVLGIVAARLLAHNYDGVPATVREGLQTRLRAQHLFTLSMAAELFRLLEEFERAGIQALLVKGPLISVLAYGDPAIRSYVDLDLIVRHRDILSVTQHMIALGFAAKIPESAILAGKVPGEYVFRRPNTQCVIELHTERTLRYYPRFMPIEDLYARQVRVPIDGRDVPVLSLEDELVSNCIHGAKHFWERLIWIADITAMCARHPELDWSRARQAARDAGAERMLRVGVQLGASVFGVQPPLEMARELAQDATTQRLCRQVLRWLPQAGMASPTLRERALFRIQMAGGGLAGIRYFFRLSLSPTEEDWVEGAEERRSSLRNAVRRPLRLLRKYGPRS